MVHSNPTKWERMRRRRTTDRPRPATTGQRKDRPFFSRSFAEWSCQSAVRWLRRSQFSSSPTSDGYPSGPAATPPGNAISQPRACAPVSLGQVVGVFRPLWETACFSAPLVPLPLTQRNQRPAAVKAPAST